MTEDYLKSLPVADVAAWYYRLADSIAINKVENSEPLAPAANNKVQISFTVPHSIKLKAVPGQYPMRHCCL